MGCKCGKSDEECKFLIITINVKILKTIKLTEELKMEYYQIMHLKQLNISQD